MAADAMTHDDGHTSFRDDFERFCSTAAAELALSSRTKAIVPDRPSANLVDDFVVGGYENPVVWHRNYNVASDRINDVLFDSMEMKYIAQAQYGRDQPEYIKLKIFGYCLVISFEYILKGKTDKALEIIGETENLLDSIGTNDTFLKSIKIAMNHVTFSMKAHVLKLCGLEKQMERFIMPNHMNNINKAGLFGIQALFFYEYDTQLSKDIILKAISINEAESEWYFLLARILCNLAKKSNNNYIICDEEFEASKTAVEIGNKVQHKLHLSSVYLRLYNNKKSDEDTRNQCLDIGLKILNETMDITNDLVLLRYSLTTLTKGTHAKNFNTLEILKKLLSKLGTSDNGYVHGSIGNYYLFNKMDYAKALFHLKKAYDAKSFGCSIDYIYTLYKLDSSGANVEPMLVEMLKTFPHPVHQEKILSQIISYLLITKDDLIKALKYIPMLLSLKNITCIYSLQNHKMKFHSHFKVINILDILSEKLNLAIKNETLPTDYLEKVSVNLNMLESFKSYVLNILPKYDNNDHKEYWMKNKQNKSIVKDEEENNWRKLKPDPVAKSHIFARGFQKSNYYKSMETQSSWFNSKK